jgi:hypothetical protein
MKILILLTSLALFAQTSGAYSYIHDQFNTKICELDSSASSTSTIQKECDCRSKGECIFCNGRYLSSQFVKLNNSLIALEDVALNILSFKRIQWVFKVFPGGIDRPPKSFLI